MRSRLTLLTLFSFVLSIFGTIASQAHASNADQTRGQARVIITFHHQPGPAQEALIQSLGVEVHHTFHLIPGLSGIVPEEALFGLSHNPHVAGIYLDTQVHAIDAELDNTWGVKRIGAGTVHDGENTGTGVKVAIIDSGIDYTHPDISANYVGGYDFVNDDEDPLDDNGHGTHVAGTVAALKNDTGVVGVAPQASLYALKVLDANGSGYWSDIIAALEWAVDNGMQVTNNSYGAGQNPGSAIETAFANADAAGILAIAAAGNSGNCGGKGNNVGYPARYTSVVAVSATNQSDSRPCFSSTGDAVELAAPGVSIYSTKLGGGYVEFNGTSMASPHVAGAAALVLAAGIADSNGNGRVNDEVRETLGATAEDLGAAGRDSHYGFGLVSAAAAVASVSPPVPPDPAVSIHLTTDKSSYISGEDTAAILTAVVQDENGVAVSGLDSAAFVTTGSLTSASMFFAETVTAGTYTASLDLTALADDTYSVETTVTDSRGLSATDAAMFDLGPAPVEPTTVSVDSISYTEEGGKNSNKHLNMKIALLDDFANPVSGATVSATLHHDSGSSWNGSATTGSDGTVTFTLKNAPSGCYETNVTSVSTEGLAWDGVTPENVFCK